MADKAAFREEIRRREQAIPERQRLYSDELLRQRFLDYVRDSAAEALLLFAGMGLEVDTWPLLETLERLGKQVCLPRCLPGGAMEARRYAAGRLTRHRYGMLEPDTSCPVVDKSELDLILVPALCYDRSCFRLGRGGGFYDRYLSDYAGMTVGLCREVLLCDRVPVDPWDRSVDMVLTEREQFGR